MVYDLTMLKTFYALYERKIERIRTILQRPLTLAEKSCMLICMMSSM